MTARKRRTSSKAKRLSLRKETIRDLDTRRAQEVMGGSVRQTHLRQLSHACMSSGAGSASGQDPDRAKA